MLESSASVAVPGTACTLPTSRSGRSSASSTANPAVGPPESVAASNHSETVPVAASGRANMSADPRR
ncbi:hypothetical protein [Streptomyces sp. NPDC008092]|uniref:hypothetical protein n=1 Tax=Streptomyces sp. NPDC008092 TaxID=3364808 RepID=UPI0036E798F2